MEVRRWAESAGVVALTGNQPWDPRWSRRPPLLVDVPNLADTERVDSWNAALGHAAAAGPAVADGGGLSPHPGTGPAGGRGGGAARHRPWHRPGSRRPAGRGRAQNSAGLQKLARRISPRATWEDLVLPRTVDGQLRSIAGRVRQRGQVFDEWRLGSSVVPGARRDVPFAGDSGTGKTMSAEVVARSLGLDLYVIDLSTVVDKYIGETEKNLDRIFVEAERVNGVLLFDEADAIFGKRSEVKDARDRYANVEVAYLLQRMEQFEGLAILTTNLRANVDEAFLRRIDVLVEFPRTRHREPGALVGQAAHAPVAGGGRSRPRLPRLRLRTVRRQYPQRRPGGGLRGGRRRRGGVDGPHNPGHVGRVQEARPPLCGVGVRPLLLAIEQYAQLSR